MLMDVVVCRIVLRRKRLGSNGKSSWPSVAVMNG